MDWMMLKPYLPEEWLRALTKLPVNLQARIQELRLRSGQPVTVSLPAGDGYLGRSGVTELRQPGLFICEADELEQIFLRLCEESVYAHEEELRQGFLSVAGGIRVGVAGTAVPGDNGVRGVGQITALCIRLPRSRPHSAEGLLSLLTAGGGLHSALLVGEPSSGKTTLLRALAEQLAANRFRVSVVDERGEIAGIGDLTGCDVLRGYPKPEGIRQAVRCLAPQVVMFDELGDEREMAELLDCTRTGVAAIATLHGRTPQEVMCRPLVRRLAAAGVFERWIFLVGRRRPGEWRQCLEPEVRANEVAWRVVGDAGGLRTGAVLRPAAVPTGDIAGAGDPAGGRIGATYGVFGPPLVGAVSGTGTHSGCSVVDAADRYAVRLG